ncbi:MAG: DNA mismatch repair endonuclease MutL [Verrucomicrobia bacterium]|nr:DNA mismatch repair endonuclease MutL [Verrucomicrobiota bacterium]
MGRIHLLSDIVANQVAAGEVVERPASVLKELVENSIDAGARKILVEFNRGGIELLRVTDDGLGMDRSDALLSLERHATSKIRTMNDLAAVITLGFRGEALPSIASVSRFRLVTRQQEAAKENFPGTEIKVEGGKIVEVKESGEAPGTKIEVRDLFYNVPARRKFLKGEQTEAAHLIAQLQFLAVAHPEIAWTCVRDGKEILRLGASENLAIRLSDLYGTPFLKRMKEVPSFEVEEISVHGFFARPGEGRSDRSHQLLFVNGRIVRNNLLSQALREACDGILPKGLQPPAVLFFKLDPSKIDCNVHPAKREIRFQEPSKIKTAALRAAQSVMGNFEQASTGIPPLQEIARSYNVQRREYPTEFFSQQSSLIEEKVPLRSTDIPAKVDIQLSEMPPQSGSTSTSTSNFNSREAGTPFRYIGTLAQRYLLLEEEEGLVLLEVSGALERITYESLIQKLLGGALQSQSLLLPQIIELSPAEASWIMAHQELLAKAGVEVELFGEEKRGVSSLKIDAVPLIAAEIPVATLLQQLVHDFQQEESRSSLKKGKQLLSVEETLARSVSGMVAQAKKLPVGETAAVMLIRDLFRCQLPYSTPSGKPTMIQLSQTELRRKFNK